MTTSNLLGQSLKKRAWFLLLIAYGILIRDWAMIRWWGSMGVLATAARFIKITAGLPEIRQSRRIAIVGGLLFTLLLVYFEFNRNGSWVAIAYALVAAWWVFSFFLKHNRAG